MPSPMRCSSGQEPGEDSRCVRVRLVGRIDYTALGAMRPLLRRMEENAGRCVRFDLSGVEFVDSFGIGLLLPLRAMVREKGGSAAFENHTPRVRRILERSGITALAVPAEPCTASRIASWAA